MLSGFQAWAWLGLASAGSVLPFSYHRLTVFFTICWLNIDSRYDFVLWLDILARCFALFVIVWLHILHSGWIFYHSLLTLRGAINMLAALHPTRRTTWCFIPFKFRSILDN